MRYRASKSVEEFNTPFRLRVCDLGCTGYEFLGYVDVLTGDAIVLIERSGNVVERF
jgi:hypothetical protein